MRWEADTTPLLTSADVAVIRRRLASGRPLATRIAAEYGPAPATASMPTPGTTAHITARASKLRLPNEVQRRRYQALHMTLDRGC